MSGFRFLRDGGAEVEAVRVSGRVDDDIAGAQRRLMGIQRLPRSTKWQPAMRRP